MPPIDDVKDMITNAVDRVHLSQWTMIVVTGPNMTPHETYTSGNGSGHVVIM